MAKKKPRPQGLPDLASYLEFSPEPAQEVLTAFGGLPLVSQTLRTLGLDHSLTQHLQFKQRQRGFSEAQMVESLILLLAAGGDCVEDLERLAADPGICEMVRHPIPSPEAARTFLNVFHCQEALETAKAQRKPEQLAFIPKETPPLEGLAQVNSDLVAALGKRMPDQQIATVDQDATIHESHKREAQMTYEGYPGYQPMVAVWAETLLVLADEFRDGNVPAAMSPLTVARRAFAALPKTVKTFYYRADSASHENELLSWLCDENRKGGPTGKIGFAVSARMSDALKQAIVDLPESSWTRYQAPGNAPDEFKEWAELPFVSGAKLECEGKPLRYLAIRIRPRQGELFADGTKEKHFAVVSNVWEWSGAKLLQWHREKAGTIEQVHDIGKNELGGKVLPSKYFGANAAWLRIVYLTHNLLQALKRLALPPELLTARPKKLRFEVLVQAGRIITHARKKVVKLAQAVTKLLRQTVAWQLLVAPS